MRRAWSSESLTVIGPFTRADSSEVAVPTMQTTIRGARYARGNGWRAAELCYAGNGLAMTVVLPDGPLPDLENGLGGEGMARILRAPQPVAALDVRLPKWRFPTAADLDSALAALGMPTAFSKEAADFSGMTARERLFISAVRHEAFVAVDEAGTEAAAATAAVASITSAGPPPVPLILDRPFLFLIHDVETSTPLFLGRVTDPSA